jgi:hypothetical protein
LRAAVAIAWGSGTASSPRSIALQPSNSSVCVCVYVSD